MRPHELPLEDSERAVLVKSNDTQRVVRGCWSTGSEDAQRLMNDIFFFAHGQPLGL